MDNVVHELAYAGLSLVLMALGAFLTRLTNDWAKKIKSEYVSNLIMRIDDLAMLVVTDVAQSWAEPRKESGEWTDTAKKEAKDKAVASLKSYIGPKGLAELLKLVGGDDSRLSELLGTAVESQVNRLKSAAPAQ